MRPRFTIGLGQSAPGLAVVLNSPENKAFLPVLAVTLDGPGGAARHGALPTGSGLSRWPDGWRGKGWAAGPGRRA